jgi:hypothetical protein
MTTTGTWLSRKTWRKLVELHATGRIDRSELQRMKLLLSRTRGEPGAVTPRAAPRLQLIRGGNQPAPYPYAPSPSEAA